MKKTITTIALFFFGFTATVLLQEAQAHESKANSASSAKVYFIAPMNGQTVSSPFTVQFGLKGMGVSPAGLDKKNTGHHHILIDTKSLPDLTMPLPSSDKLKHFGGGQTETQLTLAPGKHTLQLVLANYQHIPHSKPVISKKITITVR